MHGQKLKKRKKKEQKDLEERSEDLGKESYQGAKDGRGRENGRKSGLGKSTSPVTNSQWWTHLKIMIFNSKI